MHKYFMPNGLRDRIRPATLPRYFTGFQPAYVERRLVQKQGGSRLGQGSLIEAPLNDIHRNKGALI